MCAGCWVARWLGQTRSRVCTMVEKNGSDSSVSALCESAFDTDPPLSLQLAALRNDRKSLHHWWLRVLWGWKKDEEGDGEEQKCWWAPCRNDGPLHCAARAGDVALVEEYLNKGDDIFCENRATKEPLMVAAEAGHTSVIRVLVSHIPKNSSSYVISALQVSVSTTAQRMLAKALVQSNHTATTAVHHVLWGGKNHALQALFEAGVRPADCLWGGSPPLHMAAWLGHSACVSVLLQNGVSVNAQDRLGRTALHNASEVSDEATVDLLLTAGAETNVEDQQGLTALDLAQSEIIRQLLKDAGAVD